MTPPSNTHEGGYDEDLVVTDESAGVQTLSAGAGQALFCVGTCFHRRSGLTALSVEVGGRSHAASVWGMPRLGRYAELHPSIDEAAADRSADPELRAYRSGYWAIVPVDAPANGEVRLDIAVELENGEAARAPLAVVPVDETASVDLPEPPERASASRVAVCMATYEPDLELFERQVDSLRAQTADDWICLISDDFSSAESCEGMRAVLGDDDRFVLSRAPDRIGFYRNFERALTMVHEEAELVALCDQDDYWYPEKLEVLSDQIGDAQMIYSDQRLTRKDGSVLRDSLWVGRRRNHSNLYSMAIANTIVGASTMLRADLLARVLPFPEGPGWQFHDHWISTVAVATGEVAFVDRPLYDYVQHENAIVGRVSVEEPGAYRRSFFSTIRGENGISARWQAIYFRNYVQIALQAQVVLDRCADRVSRRERRALLRLISASRSGIGTAELAVRPIRELWGRNETLGTEWHLLKGLIWLNSVRIREVGKTGPEGGRQDVAIPTFDIISFAQLRLKRWIRGTTLNPFKARRKG